MNFPNISPKQSEQNEASLEKLILTAAGTCVVAMLYLLVSSFA